ncbi:Imm1 family immunity protein [Amycolatopsis taiwanensis]|uniref:Imm1 family immunity protein n=1 Tax=Amycolatopsis taiwanensis TaxID=342230 RepID=UPI002555F77A|nr:Imm1 family immunity protein [Amycolatopsis taiwanensis]
MVHGKYHYATTWAEMEWLINEVVEHSVPEWTGGPGISPGEIANFSFAEGRHSIGTYDWWPDNYLRVAVNPETGYGALIWYVTGDRNNVPEDLANYCWVSDNPNPPGFDPRVVADPGQPRFHDIYSVLPVAEVRAALEEFCRTGTGDRPETVRWVHGDMDGRRLDPSG